MDFRKAVKVSEGVFKPQHRDWAKCTVGTDAIVERVGRDGGMKRKGRDYVCDVGR
jgi:hypothetical protein